MKNLNLCEISPRTLKRWKAAGAPLEDDARLRTWLAGRKNLPQSIRDQLGAIVSTDGDSVPVVSNGADGGAAAALRRLEREEVAAYGRLQNAIAAGDTLAAKSERDAWLKVSESLRKYDLAIEQARREAGELMPRAEVENLISFFVGVAPLICHEEGEMLAGQLAGATERPIYEAVRGLMTLRFFETLARWAEGTGRGALVAIVKKIIREADWTLDNAAARLEGSGVDLGEHKPSVEKIRLAGIAGTARKRHFAPLRFKGLREGGCNGRGIA
jgi:hypothetical protein